MKAQARDAVAFLSNPSPLTSSLLRVASPLEACIEYLVLHIPEVDLPPRFLPEKNSSNPFITSIHAGQEDIKKRWIEERAVKQAGWPAHVVHECTGEVRLLDEWALLIAALNNRLVGKPWQDVTLHSHNDLEERITEEEIASMGASYTDDQSFTLVMPLFLAPIQLNFVIPPGYAYNRSSRPPPMYITSSSVPSYVRLHLLAKLLAAFEEGTVSDSAESICVMAMQVLEEHWAILEDQGPPNLQDVMRHLAPQEVQGSKDSPDADVLVQRTTTRRKVRNPAHPRNQDPRSDADVARDFDAVCQDGRYEELHAMRRRLPAFASKDEFLATLERSRVVVVLGETGSGKTTQCGCHPCWRRESDYILARLLSTTVHSRHSHSEQ